MGMEIRCSHFYLRRRKYKGEELCLIHGERDTFVPAKEAKDIFSHLGTDKKELLIIPSANHNDIMPVGFRKYFDAIQRFIEMTEISLLSGRDGKGEIVFNG